MNVESSRQLLAIALSGRSRMAIYDLDQTDLRSLLTPNIDPSVRSQLLSDLFKSLPEDFKDHDDFKGHGDLKGQGDSKGHDDDDHAGSSYVKKVELQISNGTDPLNPKAEVLDLTSAHNSVTTDANLKAIVENVAVDSTLEVSGTQSVFIATGGGNDRVTLHDSGNDIVMTGKGNDYVFGGAGHDSIYGGGGNDLLVAGSGDQQLLVGGDGSDSLYGGNGEHDSLLGGAGNDLLVGGSGHDQLLVGGGGNDVFYAGTGGDSMFGGAGNDVFHIDMHHGNDTVDGGGGHNVIDFDTRSSHDVASLKPRMGSPSSTSRMARP
jgi:Ca2+-binding RTX toxin-like protein